jgi:hypothetical protein
MATSEVYITGEEPEIKSTSSQAKKMKSSNTTSSGSFYNDPAAFNFRLPIPAQPKQREPYASCHSNMESSSCGP